MGWLHESTGRCNMLLPTITTTTPKFIFAETFNIKDAVSLCQASDCQMTQYSKWCIPHKQTQLPPTSWWRWLSLQQTQAQKPRSNIAWYGMHFYIHNHIIIQAKYCHPFTALTKSCQNCHHSLQRETAHQILLAWLRWGWWRSKREKKQKHADTHQNELKEHPAWRRVFHIFFRYQGSAKVSKSRICAIPTSAGSSAADDDDWCGVSVLQPLDGN